MVEMQKALLWLGVVALIASACGGGGAGGANELIAAKKAPASLAADDAAWKDAASILVKTTVIEGSAAKQGVDVKAQALYSDTDVWFRFEWADATESAGRYWVYDGTKWTSSGNEDRLALYWEITPIDKFQTRTCAALCHNPVADSVDKWYMITPGLGDRADNWHWKAARTNAVAQVDDKFLTGVLTDPKDVESANKGDAKDKGGYVDNRTADGTGPAKMQDPSKQPSAGSGFLLTTEAVAMDASKFKAGDKVPRELLEPWVGSRADIAAKGVYGNGKWTVVFHRKMDSGHDDDVKFVAGRTYPFGLSVFDNAGGVNHTVSSDVLTLQFK
jgi:hypothetical protein